MKISQLFSICPRRTAFSPSASGITAGAPRQAPMPLARRKRIENYYEKIRSGKQEKPFHEIILQVGNKDDMSADSAEGRLAADFSAGPEEILPEAGTLESAKSYR